MDNASGPTAFMPDMRRDIFDPAVVVHYAERRRGEPVQEPFPPRVASALALVEQAETVSRRRAASPLRQRLTSKIRRLLQRF